MARPPKGSDGPDADPPMPDPPYIGTDRAIDRLRQGGGGNGGDTSLEGRVSKLEAYMDTSRDDLREIRGDLKAIIGRLGNVPTRNDLQTWKWQWLAASVAIFAVVVGSIVGGLSFLKP